MKIGTFDATNDLPLHLCNLMTLFVPFVVWFKWRTAWGIIFFGLWRDVPNHYSRQR